MLATTMARHESVVLERGLADVARILMRKVECLDVALQAVLVNRGRFAKVAGEDLLLRVLVGYVILQAQSTDHLTAHGTHGFGHAQGRLVLAAIVYVGVLGTAILMVVHQFGKGEAATMLARHVLLIHVVLHQVHAKRCHGEEALIAVLTLVLFRFSLAWLLVTFEPMDLVGF